MKTVLVSRHPGTVEFITDLCRERGIVIDLVVSHLNNTIEIGPNDLVIGNLPVSTIAELTSIKARYLHLDITVPIGLRGKELSKSQLKELGGVLTYYSAIREGGL